MKKELIYRDLAKYYDLLYSFKDYKEEAETVKRLIKKYKKSAGKDLLEMACGTGRHIQYFKKDFKILATDINAGMLSEARKKVKGITFKQADMANFNLHKKFDVIICLFSSIGYIKTYSNLEKTINNFSRHLKSGGVTIIDPWHTKATYKLGSAHLTTYEGDDIKIARASVSKSHGIISVMDMHYLIAERDKDVKHFVDRHELAMFEPKKILQIMKKAGLEAKFLRDGTIRDRGVYVGVKK